MNSPVVVQHGRNDPGGTVGRRGDHPSAGGVLLVDGQRVEGDPFHGAQRVGVASPLVESCGVQRRPRAGAPSGRRAAPRRSRQPCSTHSCMTDQIRSRPSRISCSVRQDSSLASITSLIGSPSRGECSEQLRAGAERVPHRGGSGTIAGCPGLVLVEHESTADGVVLPAGDNSSRRRPERGNRMPLVWKGSRLRRCSTTSSSTSKAIGVPPSRSQPSRSPARPAPRGCAAAGSTWSGTSPEQPEHDRP